MGSLIHFRFPVLVLRFLKFFDISNSLSLPPEGNFLSHLVWRPISAFHFPTYFALDVESFLTLFGNALAKHVWFCCGLSPGPVPSRVHISGRDVRHTTNLRTTDARFGHHRRSKYFPTRRGLSLDVTAFQLCGETFSGIIIFLPRSDMTPFHMDSFNTPKTVFGFNRVLLRFRKIVFLILLFLLIRLQEAHLHTRRSGGRRTIMNSFQLY